MFLVKSLTFFFVCFRAEKQLSLINQVYQDVFMSEEARRLYDKLCNYRKVTPIIPLYLILVITVSSHVPLSRFSITI